jgi:hypothetical protein
VWHVLDISGELLDHFFQERLIELVTNILELETDKQAQLLLRPAQKSDSDTADVTMGTSGPIG